MNLPDFPNPFLLAGPTASGKSAVAAALARELGAEIVNADPYQALKLLPVLTAQPEPGEFAAVPHHLYGVLDPTEDRDAAGFSLLVSAKLDELSSRGRTAIVVSGSGLYLRALLGGLDEGLPAPDPELRAQLEARDPADLLRELEARDPEEAGRIDRRNPRRVLRALEIHLQTGRPVGELRRQREMNRVPPPAGVVMWPERDDLRERISRRALQMLGPALRDELAALDHITLSRTAARTLGLETARAWRDGKLTDTEAAALLATETWQYAKRQRTWFRKASEFLPLETTAGESASGIADRIPGMFRLNR